MATSTVSIPFENDLLQRLDEFAKKEARSREEVINQATWIFLHARLMDECQAHGRKMGLTEEIINEEVRLGREERRRNRT